MQFYMNEIQIQGSSYFFYLHDCLQFTANQWLTFDTKTVHTRTVCIIHVHVYQYTSRLMSIFATDKYLDKYI